MNLRKPLVSFVLVSLAVSVSAQFVGPGAASPYRTVAEILKSAPDDMRVELEGFIVKQVGKEKFIFTDGQSEIRVEIDQKYMPADRFDERTRLRIRGEVEKDFLESPEIDVDSVVLLK
ncbi:MAG: NirD/YgiW/YdeI family stress tolerance protein [Burkholderiaceae bacterium]|nr:NirD/YgiW/YdeI family stress tolerance protein [Burkholderiaceae bacterium]